MAISPLGRLRVFGLAPQRHARRRDRSGLVPALAGADRRTTLPALPT